jgi:hypothetical protein
MIISCFSKEETIALSLISYFVAAFDGVRKKRHKHSLTNSRRVENL